MTGRSAFGLALRRLAAALAGSLALLAAGTAFAAERLRFAAGPEGSGQAALAREIVRQAGRAAGLEMSVLSSAGGADSLLRLREEGGMNFTLLPADAVLAWGEHAGGDPDAAALLAPLRVVAPLHREVFYFIVRSDAPYASIEDIREARINIGPPRSGSALSVSTLYRLLFGAPLAEERMSLLGHEDALARLITERSLDVVALVAEQPAKLIAAMKPEARRFVKLLRFDAGEPRHEALGKVYEPVVLKAANYPNLLEADLPSLAVRIYWLAHDYRRGADDVRLARLAGAWCQQLARLKAEGHALWQDVELGRPDLLPGWRPARPAWRELARCDGRLPEPPVEACAPRERALGICDPPL